ncbi:MAG: HAD family phosphatase [Flavobacteriaceae bacterium]
MIKNIIFDFGDVFIDLDKEATSRMLIKLGFAGITPELMELFKAYETGRISTELFVEKAGKWVPGADEAQLRMAWNAILLDFPEYRLDFLKDLSGEERYRIFLLSNTNELHLERVMQKMGEVRYKRFLSCFEHCYFSHEVKMRKPDAEIFEYVLDRHRLLPDETLFIDDTQEHILSAAKLGIHTWHLKVGEEDIVSLKSKLPHD